jgi:hypothetical protein
MMRVRRSQKWREHPLQSANQDVGLSAALGQFFDLRVFGADLLAKERHFPFEAVRDRPGDSGAP